MSGEMTCEELKQRVQQLEKIELELQNSEARLKDEINWHLLLFEESRDAIVVIDQNARVYKANRNFINMLGYSRQKIYEMYVWDWDIQLTREQIMEMASSVNSLGQHFETRHRCKDGRVLDVELSNNGAVYRGEKLIFCICRDVTEKNQAKKEREELIKQLQHSLAEIKTLQGILPLCSYCKKVRDDKGYWEQVDIYLSKHSNADISHSICPDCFKEKFPEQYKRIYLKDKE